MTRTAVPWLLALLPAAAAAQQEPAAPPPAAWSVTLLAGTAWNAGTRLSISQEGSPDITVTARWSTRAFDPPLYYAVRIGRWRARAGWDLELLHHKLYLEDPPPEVARFEVTHGYNLLTVQRGWGGATRVRAGAGVVVAHPTSDVRGRVLQGGGNLPGGYHLAGPAFLAGVGRAVRVGGALSLQVEGRVSAAWARVPVAGGSADVPNVAVHLLAGLALSPSPAPHGRMGTHPTR